MVERKLGGQALWQYIFISVVEMYAWRVFVTLKHGVKVCGVKSNKGHNAMDYLFSVMTRCSECLGMCGLSPPIAESFFFENPVHFVLLFCRYNILSIL